METLSEQDSKFIKGWSCGAFFGSWIFLFVNKQKKLGWKILGLFILIQLIRNVPMFATLGQIGGTLGLVYFGISVWLGVRGREIVWGSGVYASVEEFQKKQSLVTKLNIMYIIALIALGGYLLFSTFGQYVKNPALLDQQIMQQALVKAKTSHPDINDSEFEQGYKKGMGEGKTDILPSFVADQTSSYQTGYMSGYIVACMEIHNDQMLCMKKILPNGMQAVK